MELWRVVGRLVMVGVGILCLSRGGTVAWAADGGSDTAEAAQIGTDPIGAQAGADAVHEQMLQDIEASRQTDPELAAEMEHQLELFESGELDLRQSHDAQEGGFALGTPVNDGGVTVPQGGPALLGRPGEEDRSMDTRFQQVQSDPRMQELRQQMESGGLSEGQAREQVFEILREHGLEPNNGREWDREGMSHEGMRSEGVMREGAGLERERAGGFERALEHMAPDAREQMERVYDRETAEREMSREMPSMERHEMSSREMGERDRSVESSREREEGSSAPEHNFERPEPQNGNEMPEAPTRESESPTHEQATSEHEAQAREYEAPRFDGQMPEHEQQGPPPQ